jgi:hypothetical protein
METIASAMTRILQRFILNSPEIHSGFIAGSYPFPSIDNENRGDHVHVVGSDNPAAEPRPCIQEKKNDAFWYHSFTT